MSTQASEIPFTLAEQTDRVRQEFFASLPEDVNAVVTGAFERLLESTVAANAVIVGDQAPDFTLPGAGGEQVGLSDVLNDGPVVLSFYRGGWCPFCNLELRALSAHLPLIRSYEARLIAVSPETPDHAANTAEALDLEFDVLSDAGNRVADQYGLVMQVFDELRPLYLEWGLDIPAHNGDENWRLPVPATYVIDTGGVVRGAYVNKDYTTRMEPAEVLAALRFI